MQYCTMVSYRYALTSSDLLSFPPAAEGRLRTDGAEPIEGLSVTMLASEFGQKPQPPSPPQLTRLCLRATGPGVFFT